MKIFCRRVVTSCSSTYTLPHFRSDPGNVLRSSLKEAWAQDVSLIPWEISLLFSLAKCLLSFRERMPHVLYFDIKFSSLYIFSVHISEHKYSHFVWQNSSWAHLVNSLHPPCVQHLAMFSALRGADYENGQEGRGGGGWRWKWRWREINHCRRVSNESINCSWTDSDSISFSLSCLKFNSSILSSTQVP